MMPSSTVTSWMLETSSAVWISRLYMGCLVSLPFLFRSTACNVDMCNDKTQSDSRDVLEEGDGVMKEGEPGRSTLIEAACGVNDEI